MILISVILLIMALIFIAIITYKIKNNYTNDYISWYNKSSINLIILIINIMLLNANLYYESYILAIICILILIVNIIFSILFILKFR